ECPPARTTGARQFMSGSSPLVEPDRDKPTVIALRELAAGKVGIEMLHKMAPTTTLEPQRLSHDVRDRRIHAAPRALPGLARSRARQARVRVLRIGAPRAIPQV